MAALKVMRSLVTSGRRQTERGKLQHTRRWGLGCMVSMKVLSGSRHAYFEDFTTIASQLADRCRGAECQGRPKDSLTGPCFGDGLPPARHP